MSGKSGKILELEGLRGLLACFVGCAHFVALSPNPKYWNFYKGIGFNAAHAVECFMMLSGFVIAMLIAEKQKSYSSFVCDRFFRLWPLAMVAVLFSMSVIPLEISYFDSVGSSNPSAEMRLDRIDMQLDNVGLYLASVVSFLHAFVPEKLLPTVSKSFVSPIWSIGLEWMFYLLAPLIFSPLVVKGKSRLKFGLPLIGGVFLLLAASPILGRLNSASFFNFSEFFLIGGLTYLLCKKLPSIPLSFLVLLFFLGAAGSFSIALWVFISFCVFWGEQNPVAVLCRKILLNPVLTYLGMISYSIYLMHWPVLVIINSMRSSSDSLAFQIGLFLVFVFGVILLSSITYFLVEKPGIRVGRMLKTKLAI